MKRDQTTQTHTSTFQSWLIIDWYCLFSSIEFFQVLVSHNKSWQLHTGISTRLVTSTCVFDYSFKKENCVQPLLVSKKENFVQPLLTIWANLKFRYLALSKCNIYWDEAVWRKCALENDSSGHHDSKARMDSVLVCYFHCLLLHVVVIFHCVCQHCDMSSFDVYIYIY